jgi:flagellar basal body-associated protein FliL
MKRKYQSTGFARFLFMLLIATPVAYLCAAYYTGKDGIAEIKSILLPKNKAAEPAVATLPAPQPQTPASTPAQPAPTITPPPVQPLMTIRDENLVNSQVQKYKDEIAIQQKRLDTLYLQNTALKKEVEQKDERLRTIEAQLAKINALMK